jgi:hypothetical protein
MHYERCLAAIYSDPLNHSRDPITEPILFRESTIDAQLKEEIRREYGYTSLYNYMTCFRPAPSYYGILLKTTGDIVKGSYWSDLLEDEEMVYSLS